MTTQHEQDDALRQARAQIDTIIELMTAWHAVQESEDGTVQWEGTEYDEDGIENALDCRALSVEVRGPWYHVGSVPGANEWDEYQILLCTGGTAVQLRGGIGEHGEPDSVYVEYQDWFTPWTEYRDMTCAEHDALLEFAQRFIFAW